jgi:hypothetical protein
MVEASMALDPHTGREHSGSSEQRHNQKTKYGQYSFNRFGNRLRYVLVLNQLRGDDFSILQRSKEDVRALGLGARTVSIRRLNEAAIQKIDANSSSFWAAQNSADKESTGLGLMDRQRVKTWLRGAYQEIDAVGI